MQIGQEQEDPRVRVAKRIAVVVGILVTLIFIVTGAFVVIYCTTRKPVKEYFQGTQQEAPPDGAGAFPPEAP